MSLVNQYNFLRWDDGTTPAADVTGLPNGYMRDKNRCDYMPLLVAGEAMRFYINAPGGLGIAETFANLKLDLINAVTGAATLDVSPLQKHEFEVGGVPVFSIYSEVVISGAILPGSYYFRIKGTSTTYLTSNNIQVVATTSDYRDHSVRAAFRHDRYFYGINYQDMPTFEQQFRLHFNMIETQEESNVDIYKEVTTGKRRQFNWQMDIVHTLESYYFDYQSHLAAIVMFEHSDIELNGKEYKIKGGYKITADPRAKHSKGSVEIYDQEFSSANFCV